MRVADLQPGGLFRYRSPETRVPATHPFRPLRQSVDTAPTALSPALAKLYDRIGRPSIAPEKLLRARPASRLALHLRGRRLNLSFSEAW
jgi:hypothetical protein